MTFHAARHQVPIQNLLDIPDLIPKLRQAGVKTLRDAEELLATADENSSISPNELQELEQSIDTFDNEQLFLSSFSWELLAYSEDIQADFAKRAPEVFTPAFLGTRLVYLSLSTRTLRALENAGFQTIGDVLAAQNELLHARNLGQRSIGSLFRIIGQFARVNRYILANLWNTEEQRLQPEDLIQQILGPLRERERDVLTRRYGFDGRPMTLRQTGDSLGISRERARQIQNRSIEKLREGSSLAIIDNWTSHRLPELLRRTLTALGGIASYDQASTILLGRGFSISFLCDILQTQPSSLLEKGGLVLIQDDIWAVNEPFATLCREVVHTYNTLPHSVTNDPMIPAPQRLQHVTNTIIKTMEETGDETRPFPPNERFVQLVLSHTTDLS